ncbi:MAG: TRAP transporter small permease [Lachnospiraceae bacterium]|nr:TRAP transporter small permease [Lachnospiraceae bacterium]
MKALRKLGAGITRVEEFFVVIIFIVMLGASFAQVVNRNIVQAPIGWFEELARYMQVYLCLLATELGLRDGTQMSITAVTDRLHGGTKKVVRIIAKLIVLIFTFIIFYNSITIVQKQMATHQTSPGIHVAMWIPYMALPISFGIACIAQVGLFLGILKEKPEGKAPAAKTAEPEEKRPEAEDGQKTQEEVKA